MSTLADGARTPRARFLVAEAAEKAGISPDLINLWIDDDLDEVRETMTPECDTIFLVLGTTANSVEELAVQP